jgi:hypothetical protein
MCCMEYNHIKRNSKQSRTTVQKIKSEAGPTSCNWLSQPPHDTRVKVTLVIRPLLTPVVQKLCRCEHGVFTSRACVHSRTRSKSFAAVSKCLAMCILTRKHRITTVHQLVTNFRTQEVSVCDKCSWSDKTAEITAVPISSSASAATTGWIHYCHWLRRFARKGVHV